MRKPAIPDVAFNVPAGQRSVMQALKENVEVLTGKRGGAVGTLPTDATLTETVAKLNELINRMQG